MVIGTIKRKLLYDKVDFLTRTDGPQKRVAAKKFYTLDLYIDS
jgi:hypothetical protein